MISANMTGANVYQVVIDNTGRRGTAEATSGEDASNTAADGVASTPSVHTVHMSQEYYRTLCGGTVTHEWVLIQAFRFLLERESASSILQEFDVQDINRYFPEFEETLIEQFQQH